VSHKSEIELASKLSNSNRTEKGRIFRTIASGAVSLGLIGVFALPAYASPQAESVEEPAIYTQAFTAQDAADTETAALDAPTVELDRDVIAQERLEREQAEAREEERVNAERLASVTQKKQEVKDVPAGAGASGIVAAAQSQLGQFQDCTALVERSLRATGYSVGNLGTSVGEWAQFGQVVSPSSLAPGDILIWPGQHVAIYIGNGQAVHGGWNGSNTAIASAYAMGGPSAVVRPG